MSKCESFLSSRFAAMCIIYLDVLWWPVCVGRNQFGLNNKFSDLLQSQAVQYYNRK
jgi:hypothetical protein